ncbi:NAD(P)-binding domain-containing protein [Streptomyces oceani]|uniref:NAD(P)-binding domain-containing protein n=1 Tax=Streptomyces oceani TaxID=1075402 RepID=UPI0009A0BB20|nr:NAD(P)-binding domain-containing protein [Streptomyces oceani]
MQHVDIVVIGAGQAGLSSAYHLRRLGLTAGRDFVVLDHSPRPGGAWQFRWPTLTYDRVHGMHALPGMELSEAGVEADPDRPSSGVVGDYFAAYENAFGLRVRRPVHVRAVREAPDDPRLLLVETSAGTWRTRGVVSAAGTWDRPFWPYFPGRRDFRGRQLHTADYPGPDSEAFADKRVVVIGAGTSAVQHLLEIGPVAAHTTWVTRREPLFREGPFGSEEGREAVARVEERVRDGLPPRSVVSVTGLPMNEAIRRARESGLLTRHPLFERITPEGVRWPDGHTVSADTLLWATGFRPVVAHLAPLRLREPAGGIALDGTRVIGDPRVHLVGYGPSASTIGANRAGRTAARGLLRLLGQDTASPAPEQRPYPVPLRGQPSPKDEGTGTAEGVLAGGAAVRNAVPVG